MAFIELPADQDADGQAAELFAADQRAFGYVANLTRLFALRPAVYQAWRQLTEAIKANMDPREYDAGTVVGIATDHRRSGLAAALRACGLSDTGILDVALAAAARCFFSTVLDAMGTEPDAAYRTELEPALQEALAVGRPIAGSSG